MTDYSSIKKIASKTAPEVVFVFRVMSEGVRAKLTFLLAEPLERIRILRAELNSIELPADKETAAPPDVIARLNTLVDKAERINRFEIDRAYFDACYVGFEGVTIDGRNKLTAAEFIDLAPEELLREFVKVVRFEAEMTREERANLQLPTTSTAEGDGKMNDSNAETADEKVSMKEETADDSSPRM